MSGWQRKFEAFAANSALTHELMTLAGLVLIPRLRLSVVRFPMNVSSERSEPSTGQNYTSRQVLPVG